MNNQGPVSGSECGFKPGWSLPADANESPVIFSDGVSLRPLRVGTQLAQQAHNRRATHGCQGCPGSDLGCAFGREPFG
jgi:hypothetical protein